MTSHPRFRSAARLHRQAHARWFEDLEPRTLLFAWTSEEVYLTELLNRPIHRADDGPPMPVEAVAIDAGGHRTEAVKA